MELKRLHNFSTFSFLCPLSTQITPTNPQLHPASSPSRPLTIPLYPHPALHLHTSQPHNQARPTHNSNAPRPQTHTHTQPNHAYIIALPKIQDLLNSTREQRVLFVASTFTTIHAFFEGNARFVCASLFCKNAHKIHWYNISILQRPHVLNDFLFHVDFFIFFFKGAGIFEIY